VEPRGEHNLEGGGDISVLFGRWLMSVHWLQLMDSIIDASTVFRLKPTMEFFMLRQKSTILSCEELWAGDGRGGLLLRRSMA
jgi:hypothetical protein